MIPEMKEYIKLVVRLEAAANMVLEHGLKCGTRLELEESVNALAGWIEEEINHEC